MQRQFNDHFMILLIFMLLLSVKNGLVLLNVNPLAIYRFLLSQQRLNFNARYLIWIYINYAYV